MNGCGGDGRGVLRLVCGQLALVAAGLAFPLPWQGAVPLWVGAAVVAALAGVRVRGRWLSERLARRLAFRLRRRPGSGSLLDVVAPDAEVRGEHVHTDDGVTTVLRPRIAAPRVLAELTAPDVRVVCHAGVNRNRPPRAWVAVHAPRTPDLWRDEEVTRVLGNAVRRTRRELRRRGVAVDVLTGDEVVATVAALGHATPDRRVRESWRYWHCGPVAQACFRVPEQAARAALDWLLTATPGVAVTVALTAGADAVVRVAATAEEAVDAAVRLFAAHLRLERLDGMHARGVLASLPLGGVL